MDFLTVIYFFVVIWALGKSATVFVKRSGNFFERNLMNLGIGIATFVVLGNLLNMLHVPINWLIILVLSLVLPTYQMIGDFKKGKSHWHKIKNKDFSKITVEKSTLFLIPLLLMFGILLGVYLKGTFSYPWLEDDDPWGHAISAKYISVKETFSRPIGINTDGYYEPYPQGYDLLIGTLHQTNDSMYWTLKFFNVLFIALGILFSFYFFKDFLKSHSKALFASFVLFIIPCFISHFIWSSTVAITLFFVALYSLQRIKEDKRWWIVSSIVIAGLLMTQHSNGFIFGVLFFVYWTIKSLCEKNFNWLFLFSGIVGLIIAVSLFWGPMLIKYGVEATAGMNSIDINNFSKSIKAMGSGGEAVYTLNDLIDAKEQSKMDNPIGIGEFLFFLFAISIIAILYRIISRIKRFFSEETTPLLVSLIWAGIALVGIFSNTLNINMVMPHRWWAILCIPLAIISAEGFSMVMALFKRFKINPWAIGTVIILGIILTSGYPKYVVETSNWPFGVKWTSQEELSSYLYLKSLPSGEGVFTPCHFFGHVIAYDKMTYPWENEVMNFKDGYINKSQDQVVSFMKKWNYDYVALDHSCLPKFGANETNDLLLRTVNDKRFELVYPKNDMDLKGMFLFRLLA